jgi:hypothetical protein
MTLSLYSRIGALLPRRRGLGPDLGDGGSGGNDGGHGGERSGSDGVKADDSVVHYKEGDTFDGLARMDVLGTHFGPGGTTLTEIRDTMQR